jgi:16S rRNA (cytosine1402-N4)-methyltransferase
VGFVVFIGIGKASLILSALTGTTDLFSHIPVLAEEVLSALAVTAGGYYLDATVGAGGHTRLILQAVPDVRVLGVDRDAQAIAQAKENLAEFGDRVEFWRGNFADLPVNPPFDGILLDLGVSSPQLDLPERGFSFRHQAPLDMRMDTTQKLTAAEVVNHWDQKQLADLFFHYGEERYSRRIARKIVQSRPFETTTDLADAIAAAVPPKYRYGRIHSATRVFQALRIAVNEELSSLERFLGLAENLLKPEGRLAAISFHSLEDRIVKHHLRQSPSWQVLTKKPIEPTASEKSRNPRSRSAKLRLAAKC